MIAGLVYVYMPFMVLPLYATIERLDLPYLEASLDLGAQSRTFLSVTLPLTMPGSCPASSWCSSPASARS